MVWKSDRWNALVDVVVAEDTYKEHTEPEMIQIAYHRGPGSAVVTEEVYEDPERVEMPRLLVSLSSVSALKELCEHEHARSDKLTSMLSKCRAAYYKELRWLRDQLQLAYRTDEEAEARKALLTPDDFEVYWYEPAQYVDDDTRDFLLKCIAETNRKLIDENNKLRSELAQHHILESAILPTVLRRLRKEYSPSAILTELHAQLKTKQEIKDFQEGVSKLLNQKITLQVEEIVPDDALLAAQAELAALREERAAQERQLAEMRVQLSSGIDAQLERERANAEREQADLVQARAEFILRQHEALKRELRSGEMEVAHRVRRSVSKLTEVMQVLTPAGSRSNSPIKGGSGGSPTKFHMPLNLMESTESGESKEEASFDGALSMLDEVASGFACMAGDVVQEMQDLRNRVAMLEMSKRCQEVPAAEPETVIQMETDKSSSRLRADLEALQLRFVEEQKKLVAEKVVTERLQGQLSEANEEIERLRERILFLESKVDKLRARVKTLEEASGVEPDADSDKEDTGGRYQTPYRKRALISTKNRWELLAEDAACRRRQTRLNELRLKGIDPNSPEGEAMLAGRGPGHEAAASRSAGHRQEAMAGRRSHHQEVAKAFHFLSAGQTLSGTPPPASSDLVVLRQLDQSQPQFGRPSVSRSSRRLSSPIPFRAPSTSPLSSTRAETPSAGQSMSSTSLLASSDLAALRQLDRSQPQLSRPTVSQPSRPRRMSSPIPFRAQTASVAMRETRYTGQAGYRVADEVSWDQGGNPSGLLALPGYREGGIPAPPQRRLSDFNGTGQALRAVTPGTGYQELKPRPRSRASPPRLLSALHPGAQSAPGLERTTILLAHAIHPLEALPRPPEAHAFKDMPAFQVDSVTEAEHLPHAKAPPVREPQEAKVQAAEAESAPFRFAAQPFDWNVRLPTPARHTLKALEKALPEASFGGLDWALRRTSGVPLTNPMSRAKRPLKGVLDARLPKCGPEHNMFTVDPGPSFPPGRKRRSSLPSFPTSRHTP